MVGDALVAFPLIPGADPQRPDGPPRQDRRGVDRLTGRDAREAPAGSGPEVAGALSEDHHLGVQDEAGRQQPGVHGDRLQVAAERLRGGHRGGQRARGGQRRDRHGEPGGQRTPVRHHVHHPGSRAYRLQPGQNRR